jgi:hypothetical protein
MASDDTPPDGPSIAPPSFGPRFRRRTKGGGSEESVPVPPAPPEPEVAGEVEAEVEVETAATDVADASERPATIFAAGPTVSAPDDDDPTVFTPLVDASVGAPTGGVRTDRAAEAPTRKPRRERAPRPPRREKVEKAPREPRPPRDLTVPTWLKGRVAAMLTGLLVGLFLVAATVLALRGCAAVRDTSSCGGGPGFFLLVAILVLGVLVGSALLSLADVSDAVSTSVLAAGLTSLVAVVFLVDHLLDWWMIIAIPLVSVATFALSHWVTTSFSEPSDRGA